MLVIEQEFASVLNAMRRQGNSLSAVVHLAWDGGKLQTMTKNSPETATGAHISIVTHITVDELRRLLDQVHFANGFANRFLFLFARRSKLLPFPRSLDHGLADRFATNLREILTSTALRGRGHGRQIVFDPQAEELWIAEYASLSAEKPGIFGFLVAGAEAQVLRLAMIYALLETYRIGTAHLRAALAFWRYCEASAKYVFGDALGNPIADEILVALRSIAPDAMTRSEIRRLFGDNQSSERIGQALLLLLKHGKARLKQTRASGQGRPHASVS